MQKTVLWYLIRFVCGDSVESVAPKKKLPKGVPCDENLGSDWAAHKDHNEQSITLMRPEVGPLEGPKECAKVYIKTSF